METQIKELSAKMDKIIEIESKITKLENRIDGLEKNNQCQIRSSITRIYYQYRNAPTIPFYEHENLSYLYDEYLKTKGNSYVPNIVPGILAKPVESE